MGEASAVEGHCEPRFARVREAFARNLVNGFEVGASFAAFLEGALVVDLWGGFADAARTRLWERDTIVNVYSSTKTMAATVVWMLADRGALDLDAPVARYWPEFAQGGKAGVRVRHVLSHTAGVPGWDERLAVDDLFDHERSVAPLAAQAPWWEPGREAGYHAVTQGQILAELVRRVDGRTLGTFFREEVAEPLGADFWIGLPREHEPRVAEMIPPDPPRLGVDLAPEPGSIAARVLGNPPLTGDVANRREWREAELPAANGHGNARALARVAGALARGGEIDGRRLLGASPLERALEQQHYATDLVLGVPVRWSLGFALVSREMPLSPNRRTLFWGGWGGSLVVVDLDAHLGFAYAMNRMASGTLGDARGFGLAIEIYRALEA